MTKKDILLEPDAPETPTSSLEEQGGSTVIQRVGAFFRGLISRQVQPALPLNLLIAGNAPYRSTPPLSIENIPEKLMEQIGVEKVEIPASPDLHNLFEGYLSSNRYEGYNLREKYAQITGFKLNLNFKLPIELIAMLVQSRYFLHQHQYLFEVSSAENKYDTPILGELLKNLIETAQNKAKKYLFKREFSHTPLLSQLDIDELMFENCDLTLAKLGFDAARFKLSTLPIAGILADPSKFRFTQDKSTVVGLPSHYPQSNLSFLVSVDSKTLTISQNCCFGNRLHTSYRGGIRCSNSHQLGVVRLMIEPRV